MSSSPEYNCEAELSAVPEPITGAPAFVSQWFAVYTTPRHEKAVARQLSVREIEAFLPLYRAVRRWKNGSRVSLELPLFPNYLFVRIERREWARVLQTPGVISFAGSSRGPAPLLLGDMDALRSGLALRSCEPHPYLNAGERVRIVDGALAGMTGMLLRRKNLLRVVLSIDLIMQSVAVEVGIEEIEPVRYI